MLQNLKMPPSLFVLGVLYALVAVFYFYDFIRDGYWNGVASEIKKIIASNWKLLLFFIAIFIILVSYVDLPVTQWCKVYYNKNWYAVFDFINSVGEGWFIGGIIFSCFMIFQFLQKLHLAIVTKISFMATIYAGLTNAVLKTLINRSRPSATSNPQQFFHVFSNRGHDINDLFYAANSMPSGHTITIFAAITPFLLFTQKTVAKALLLGVALLILIARVYTINHWLSDVYVSTLLGLAIGWAVFLCNRHRLIAVGAAN